MFSSTKKVLSIVNKKLFLTLLLAVSPIVMIGAGCGTWNRSATAPVSGATVTATPTNSPTPTPTTTPAAACPNPVAVVLGQAGNYVMLAETGITDIPSSAVTGNVGNSPGSGTQIGITCAEVNGTIFATDALGPNNACQTSNYAPLTTAITDKGTAITTANGQADCVINQSAGILSGLTLTRGTYYFNTGVSIPTDLHLDALGDPNAVWIFQVTGTLTMASSMNIILDNGALASNVFWTVTGFTQISANAHFEGVIMGDDYIQLVTGASVHGRLLTHTYIALDQNVVTQLP